MGGLDNTAPISGTFTGAAGEVGLTAKGLEVENGVLKVNVGLSEASNKQTQLESASKVAIYTKEMEKEFYESPETCPHVSIDKAAFNEENVDVSLFKGVTVDVPNLGQQQLESIEAMGCAVAVFDDGLNDTQLASNTNPTPGNV